MPAPDRESRDRPWVMIFILLSLIAHLVFVLGMVLVSHFLPKPKLLKAPQELSSTSLSLEQAPPPPVPKKQRTFLESAPDSQAHKPQEVESDNDAVLKSKSQEARQADSIMPDIRSKKKHAVNLKDTPDAPSKKPPQLSAAGAQTKPSDKASPTPPTQAKNTPPNPSQAPMPTTQPEPLAKQATVKPAKTQQPTTAKEQLDPNGLPVLPALVAPTMAPPSAHQDAVPVSSVQEDQTDSHGAVGFHGDDSPAAMATDFGKYKAKVYRAISSRWHPKVEASLSLLPVGMVHIQFTIYKDGRVETKVLEGDAAALQILLSISQSSIIESAPFDPFTQNMVNEVGESYTDDCTFSIYGQ